MRQLKIQKSITNRSSEALDKYLVEIGRAPLISIDEEIELAQKIKKGGREGEIAKDKLVTANLRFVVSVAKQYQHQGLTLTDFIDEGYNIGNAFFLVYHRKAFGAGCKNISLLGSFVNRSDFV